MISFHLNDIELLPYHVLDSEVNPSESTHCRVTVRLYVAAVLNGHCWNRKEEGATSVLSEGSGTCAEQTPLPPPKPVVLTHVRRI